MSTWSLSDVAVKYIGLFDVEINENKRKRQAMANSPFKSPFRVISLRQQVTRPTPCST